MGRAVASPPRIIDPRLVAAAVLAAIVGVVGSQVIALRGGDMGAAALWSAVPNGLVAALAAGALFLAARRAENRARRVWAWLAAGCALWAAGTVPYAVYIATGGSVTNPQAWSQAGYLLAYVPWFRGLWLLRQPVVAESVVRRVETVAIEVASLLILATTVMGLLWYAPVPASDNLALLTPIALDMVLVAATYYAVRRTALELRSAYPWLVGAFASLTVADAGVSYAVSRGELALAPVASWGYSLAMGLLAVGAGRALTSREVGLAGERVTAAVAMFALALVGPAAVLAPEAVHVAVWVVGAALAWRVHALLRRQGRTDEDPITGLFDARSITRHIAGMIAAASAREPIALIGVDVRGFGAWNSGHGFAAGDALLSEIAEACASAHIGTGVWGRIGADRFCWVGRVADLPQARTWAETVVEATDANGARLPTRAAVVVAPSDATTAANALDGLAEALEAADLTGKRVVAFDRGLLDGAAIEGEYSASFRVRRARVAEVIGDPGAITSVFQPIVRLDDVAVQGHEVLSRVLREPRRGPDQWIGEAHQVGLGLEIEAACIRRACGHRGAMPPGTYMSVNMSPQLILSGLVEDLLPEGRLDWLMIEITEHEQVRDYAHLAERLAGVRARGAGVAVDDLGAGHSTLRHLMRLSPDVAKLDRSLIQDIDADPAKQALVRSMTAFSREMGCRLVAEGVETLAELEVLRGIGVEFAQGYLFRRPAPEMSARIEAVLPPAPDAPVSGLSVIEGGRGRPVRRAAGE